MLLVVGGGDSDTTTQTQPAPSLQEYHILYSGDTGAGGTTDRVLYGTATMYPLIHKAGQTFNIFLKVYATIQIDSELFTIIDNNYIPPTIILLMGMCTSLTKNPTKPMIRKPIPVALATRKNSIIHMYLGK